MLLLKTDIQKRLLMSATLKGKHDLGYNTTLFSFIRIINKKGSFYIISVSFPWKLLISLWIDFYIYKKLHSFCLYSLWIRFVKKKLRLKWATRITSADSMSFQVEKPSKQEQSPYSCAIPGDLSIPRTPGTEPTRLIYYYVTANFC